MRAVRRIWPADCAEGKLKPGEISEEVYFEAYLDTHGIPDPDLLIRTSGELQIIQLSALAACIYGILFYGCSVAGFFKSRTGKGD